MNNGYQPFVFWKACESRFYYLGVGQIMEDAFPITDASAMQLREERRADFGDNAQRIVDNMIHNAKVTRGIGDWNRRALTRMSKNPNTRANSSRT